MELRTCALHGVGLGVEAETDPTAAANLDEEGDRLVYRKLSRVDERMESYNRER